MSHKLDLQFQKHDTSFTSQHPPQQQQPFISYLKQQHQQSLQTIQNLQNKIQILQKSIQHLQSRIKLKDLEIHQKQQEISNRNVQIEEIKGVNNNLNGKMKMLKKQVGKLESENRELAELLENQREILRNWNINMNWSEGERERVRGIETEEEQERDKERQRKQMSREKQRERYLNKNKQNEGFRKRTGRINIDLQNQVDYLTHKNTQLQKHIYHLQQQLQNFKPSPDSYKKQFQRQQLFTLVSKLHQQQIQKTNELEELKLQHNKLFKQNVLIKEQLLGHGSFVDSEHSSFRRETRVSVPNTHNEKFNTVSSNRNNNNSNFVESHVEGRRRVGSIKIKNSDDSRLDQSELGIRYDGRNQEREHFGRRNNQFQGEGNRRQRFSEDKNAEKDKLGEYKRQTQRLKEREREKQRQRERQREREREKEKQKQYNQKRQQNSKKQHLLQALVARFQKLKVSSLTNTAAT